MASPAPSPEPLTTSRRPSWAVPALASAVAVTPIVVATVRALARGWIPVGDNAYFAIRARDVLTEHHPLVGAWSSGSEAIGVDVNNLGPLQLDLLAPFVRVLGFGPGTAIAVALVNAASAVAIVVLAHRRLGALGAWLGAAMAGSMAWALGSELLYEPRQHHALVLPFLALLVATWAVVAGERWALPVATGLACLVAQTHLTFVLPVAVLAVAAAVGAVVGLRRGPGWTGPIWVSAGIAVVAWAQPFVEQLTADGQGNLSAVADAAGGDAESFGARGAVRAVAQVVAPPDGWWPSSFREFDPASLDRSTGVATVILALLVAVLVLLWGRARRAGDRPVAAWLVTAVLALAIGVVASARVPTSGPFGAVSGNFRFLWPIAVFSTFGVVAALARSASPRAEVAARTAVAVLAVVLALLAVPSRYESPGPEGDAPRIPVARSLLRQVRDADLEGPVLVDRSGVFFGEPYTYVVLAALQQAGVDLLFDTDTDVARFGDDRRRDGPVTGTISVATGDAALEDRPGATLVARASSLDDDERARLAELARADLLTETAADELADLEDQQAHGTVAVWFTPCC